MNASIKCPIINNKVCPGVLPPGSGNMCSVLSPGSVLLSASGSLAFKGCSRSEDVASFTAPEVRQGLVASSRTAAEKVDPTTRHQYRCTTMNELVSYISWYSLLLVMGFMTPSRKVMDSNPNFNKVHFNYFGSKRCLNRVHLRVSFSATLGSHHYLTTAVFCSFDK